MNKKRSKLLYEDILNKMSKQLKPVFLYTQMEQIKETKVVRSRYLQLMTIVTIIHSDVEEFINKYIWNRFNPRGSTLNLSKEARDFLNRLKFNDKVKLFRLLHGKSKKIKKPDFGYILQLANLRNAFAHIKPLDHPDYKIDGHHIIFEKKALLALVKKHDKLVDDYVIYFLIRQSLKAYKRSKKLLKEKSNMWTKENQDEFKSFENKVPKLYKRGLF